MSGRQFFRIPWFDYATIKLSNWFDYATVQLCNGFNYATVQ